MSTKSAVDILHDGSAAMPHLADVVKPSWEHASSCQKVQTKLGVGRWLPPRFFTGFERSLSGSRRVRGARLLGVAWLSVGAFSIGIVGCGSTGPEGSPSPSVAPSATPSVSPGVEPTPTPVLNPTPTATARPEPTSTLPPGVTPTPGPEPTATEQPPEPTPTAAPTPVPITPTPQVYLVPEGSALSQTLDPLLSPLALSAEAGDIGFLQAFPDFSVVFSQNGHLFLTEDGSSLAADLGTVVGEPHSAAWLEGVGALISGKAGLFVLADGALSLSPLNAALASTTPVTLLTAESSSGQDLWMVASSGLYLYRKGSLYRINLQSAFSADLRLAFGAPVSGTPSLWLSGSTGTWSLTETSGKFSLRAEFPEGLGSIAADEAGNLLGVLDGMALRRTAQDSWRYLGVDGTLASVRAAQGGGVWAQTDTGLWWLQSAEGQESLHLIARTSLSGVVQADWSDDGASASLSTVDPWGRLLLTRAASGVRVAEGTPVLLSGLEQSPIEYPTELRVHPSFASNVTGVEVRNDGGLLAIPSNPWSFTFDPLEVGEGEHSLDVKVSYGSQSTHALWPVSVRFPTATWDVEITDIFLNNCVFCHGEEGGAHPLYTSAQWQEEIDAIIGVTSSGYMPQGRAPLTPEEVYTIKVWQALNFP